MPAFSRLVQADGSCMMVMVNDAEFVKQAEGWGARFLPRQRLGRYTSLGVGGEADFFLLRRTDALEPLVEGLRQRGIPWTLL